MISGLSFSLTAMLDDMYRQLAEKGLSQSSVKYAHRIMGVSLEHARRYHYISSNPARDILTKFGKQSKTPDPYTVDQMRQLLAVVMGTEWELIVVLGGLYGLRLSENEHSPASSDAGLFRVFAVIRTVKCYYRAPILL